MNFTFLDIGLLVLFAIAIGIFLFKNRKNLKKEGFLLLCKTKWGINLINKTAKKYPKTLRFLSYVSIILGYLLMLGMIYLFIRVVWIYIFHTEVVKIVKIPPIAPLIPYLPQIFKLNFLPPFYFIYWIIILAVIAISHEFFHGIFASLYQVKIKKTGFGFFPFFLPIFLAAFVELDEKQMQKKSNFSQRAVLSAGTFANILVAGLILILIFIFYPLSFHAGGIVFDDYVYNIVNVSSVTLLNGISLNNPSYNQISEIMNKSGENIFVADNLSYYGYKGATKDKTQIALYYDTPAIKENIYGPIIAINEFKVNSIKSFEKELSKYKIGDEIIVATKINGEQKNYKIVLKENPLKPNSAWMGVTFFNQQKSFVSKFFSFFSSYKEPHIYYEPKYSFAVFIYDLLWWLVLISFSVALVNMLPMGIFDGGRFFYLTVLLFTKSEKIAKKSFKIITAVFLALLFLIMIFWFKGLF
jgi:membrane-associated protease RseP (regulator of RpoE activity)